ncbi:hypothetical protein DBV15_07539 [Temnothorax longispinosus]|uniref:Uncharacterized protein n=1 Tax=Temnothorax longispinosus TaxID=300112 RepID=A0A4S2JVL1_9HYME|nr:hypothetical protein DBV15_07539 [Temnothorax longispinosus]
MSERDARDHARAFSRDLASPIATIGDAKPIIQGCGSVKTSNCESSSRLRGGKILSIRKGITEKHDEVTLNRSSELSTCNNDVHRPRARRLPIYTPNFMRDFLALARNAKAQLFHMRDSICGNTRRPVIRRYPRFPWNQSVAGHCHDRLDPNDSVRSAARLKRAREVARQKEREDYTARSIIRLFEGDLILARSDERSGCQSRNLRIGRIGARRDDRSNCRLPGTRRPPRINTETHPRLLRAALIGRLMFGQGVEKRIGTGEVRGGWSISSVNKGGPVYPNASSGQRENAPRNKVPAEQPGGRRRIINHGLGRLTRSILRRVGRGLLSKTEKWQDDARGRETYFRREANHRRH